MKTLLDRYRALATGFREILRELEAEIAPGRTLLDLDRAAQDAIARRGFASNFKDYRGYPAFITASLNHEVMNTVPDGRRLREGDLLKLQVGIRGGGAHAYQSWTYAIGSTSAADRRLIEAGRAGLERALEATSSRSVAAISRAIQGPIEAAGFAANRDYVGHGMGVNQHEPPQIPCAAIPGYDERLRPGQILSLQSIAHAGTSKCRTLQGGNVVTLDGRRAVMFSQMVAVGVDGPPDILLEPRDPYLACGEGRPSIWSRLLKDRKILIGTPIDGQAAQTAIAQLLFLEQESRREPVTVLVNSPGGYVAEALAIFDALSSRKPPIRTICLGRGDGMAALLVAAGTKGLRACLPSAAFQLVPLEGTGEIDALRSRVAALFAKATGRAAAAVLADMNARLALDASAAVRYGLVDQIVENPF